MSTVRITESRDPHTDPPPSGEAVLALTRYTHRGESKYRRVRAMRLDPYWLECDDEFGPGDADWYEEAGVWCWPAGWYECTAYPMNLPECEGQALLRLEWECEIVAWMKLPRFAEQEAEQ